MAETYNPKGRLWASQITLSTTTTTTDAPPTVITRTWSAKLPTPSRTHLLTPYGVQLAVRLWSVSFWRTKIGLRAAPWHLSHSVNGGEYSASQLPQNRLSRATATSAALNRGAGLLCPFRNRS